METLFFIEKILCFGSGFTLLAIIMRFILHAYVKKNQPIRVLLLCTGYNGLDNFSDKQFSPTIFSFTVKASINEIY